ncbi:hypothetical protein UFOVP331_135 [uncultured Caudovirales phage]|uniref:Uncharacterized protein n=1 Tax=uncultured Caudovirales phage TaxID=2100421 RepID=A0A6J5LVU5_9CAUD|nr:hypothetical protein UFOVP331_135 [uncultured Caudovirales phage]
MKNNYITFDVKIGDKVKFYVMVPEQNIGTTGEERIGTVIKINPKTFVVKDESGNEYKIDRTWYKGASYLPSIITSK